MMKDKLMCLGGPLDGEYVTVHKYMDHFFFHRPVKEVEFSPYKKPQAVREVTHDTYVRYMVMVNHTEYHVLAHENEYVDNLPHKLAKHLQEKYG